MATKPWRWMSSRRRRRAIQKDHPRIELLRHKGIAMMRTWPVGEWLATNRGQGQGGHDVAGRHAPQRVVGCQRRTVALSPMRTNVCPTACLTRLAGVDIEAGDRAVRLFQAGAARATRTEVRGGIGGFAAVVRARGGHREPVLASSTDGVERKLAVAQAMDKHDTVGLDLAMVVDDLVVCGAEPLFPQDPHLR